jgi:hypothetical protein
MNNNLKAALIDAVNERGWDMEEILPAKFSNITLVTIKMGIEKKHAIVNNYDTLKQILKKLHIK